MLDAATGSGAVRTAVIVDDVGVNRQLAAAFLGRMGWRVVQFDGGASALAWIADNPAVDLILLDIGMPGQSGEEVCRVLRADPRFAHLPVVAYTAHALANDVERFLTHGFDAVLIKPISQQMMKDVIGRLFPD